MRRRHGGEAERRRAGPRIASNLSLYYSMVDRTRRNVGEERRTADAGRERVNRDLVARTYTLGSQRSER